MLAFGMGKRAPGDEDLIKNLGALGVICNSRDGGACQDQLWSTLSLSAHQSAKAG
jgi:hypothetical protein